ncbi:MAG: hypothetical protein PBU42_03820 [Acinetobacter haemolyticus]|uniref:hypothetical protein n=1 Tax=Acinetobacter haemolyticus TaxID=29430 RepID=UPI000D6874F8|nr:hypothetical protein [Acinetobacter haemolyticus]
MINFEMLEEKINQLGIGEFLFIGRSFDLSEMPIVLRFLKNLETKKVLRITYLHTNNETGENLVDLIKIQKMLM